jgi:hypothetical protein
MALDAAARREAAKAQRLAATTCSFVTYGTDACTGDKEGNCVDCEEPRCGEHVLACNSCDKCLCEGCGTTCSQCCRVVCAAHVVECIACGALCASCSDPHECHKCSAHLCDEHSLECNNCGKSLCDDCATKCTAWRCRDNCPSCSR